MCGVNMADTRPAPYRRLLGAAAGPRGLLLAIGIGVALRLIAIAVIDAETVNLHEFGTIGHNIVDGHGFSYHAVGPDGTIQTDGARGDATLLTGPRLPSAFLPPAYTAVVAGAIASVGGHVATVHLLQLLNLVVAVGATVLMYRLGRLLGGSVAGTAAAWGFALYPPLIYAATQVSAVNLYLPLEMAVMLALLEAARRTGLRATVVAVTVAAVALGVLCLFRSEAIILAPVAAVFLVLARRRYRRGRAALAGALVLCLALVLPAAWIARNNLVLDRPVLTITTSGGFNLWIGNHDGATGSQKQYATPAATEQAIARLPVTDGYEVDLDGLYRSEALRSILGDPLGTAVRDLGKLAMMLGVDVHDSRATHPLYLGSWAVLLVLGIGGLVTARRRGPVRWLLFGQLAVALAVPTVFFALARHRLGVEFVLLLYAGAFLARFAARGPAAAAPTAVPAPASPGRDEPAAR